MAQFCIPYFDFCLSSPTHFWTTSTGEKKAKLLGLREISFWVGAFDTSKFRMPSPVFLFGLFWLNEYWLQS